MDLVASGNGFDLADDVQWPAFRAALLAAQEVIKREAIARFHGAIDHTCAQVDAEALVNLGL